MATLYSWNREGSASLFERIQGKNSGSSRQSRMRELLNSIKRHLNHVLNTHPGACQSAADLGVIDLNDATTTATDFKQSIEQAIVHCITNYEPRISSVTVSAIHDDSDPLLLRFHISAQVSLDDIHDAVEFNIQLDNNRRYCLERTQ
ncbi:type VI secretion system baseplate subunit TssE [Photorhabdus luminescens]|uniref:type VI secretion system baseplate subunit TssE n=1 Tax=Photorhabdus akhurstii TaxID=171438 RepID=UPI000590DF74|nr:type VI secretion system baseplate subunit TssE [Photorhabdus akhurstii]MBS9429280.1 type VI secretion system baseplate subunit TssE [Photorhabdus akhurstii]PQQ28750.1 type VI secretion system baseplate subunit TssE [Photorhabdus luminescens]